MCPACYLALVISTLTSGWVLFRKQMKRLLSIKLYRWYIEELREEILDIINSEDSGLSHQARLDKIREVLKDTIEEEDK